MLEAVLLISSCLCLSQASGSEPTVIFLGANGRPVASNSNDAIYSPSSNYGSLITSLKSRESSKSASGGGSLYSLIRERLGERLQERSSKKGPRIIVIPQATKSQPQQQQQQGSGYQQPAAVSYSASYPSHSPYSSYSSSYVSPAASSSYPSYAPYSYTGYQSLYSPQYSSQYSPYGTAAYPMSYGSVYSYGTGPSSMQASASTPLASYAYAPSNFLSSLMSSGSSAASSLLTKSTYSSLYPYLTQALAQTFY